MATPYNPIKRLKSWFFQTDTPTESRTFTDGNGNNVTKQVKTRLAKGNFPKEETFKDLLHSIFFKSSGNDLQDIASTSDIENAVDVEKVVKPNQLPELEQDIAGSSGIASNSSQIDGYFDVVYETKQRIVGGKKKWAWYFTTNFANWLFSKLVPKGGTTGQVLTKASNSDNHLQWSNIPTSSGSLPSGGTTNQYLRKINNTDYNVEWANRDWYSQAEINTLLNNESLIRSNIDGRITNDLNSLVDENTFYATHNLELFKTRIDNADTVNSIQNTDISNLQTSINSIINGATLPASSLQSLQNQINALSFTPAVKTLINPTNTVFNSISNNIGLGFTKIGNMVFIDGQLRLNTLTTVAGNGLILYTNNSPASIRPVSTTYRHIAGLSVTDLNSFPVSMYIYDNGNIFLQKHFETSPVDYTTSEIIQFNACYFVD